MFGSFESEVIGKVTKQGVDLAYVGNDNDLARANFTVSVPVYNKKEGKSNYVMVRVTAWRGLAEICGDKLGPKTPVVVKGRMSFDTDTGGPVVFQRKNGDHGANFEITADKIVFPADTYDNAGSSGGASQEEDDIPF